MKVLRRLLLYFLLGGGLYAASLATADWRAPWQRTVPIHIADAEVRSLRNAWTRETGRMPSAAEMAASLRKFADDETLFREALRLRLDHSDPVVRARLIQNLRFTDPATQQGDDALLREALALGMARHDTVVRRRLVQAMEQRLARGTPLSEAELRRYVASHPERYTEPERRQFTQVFLSADGQHKALAANASALGETLKTLAANAPEAAALGEAFLLGPQFGPGTQQELAQRLGQPFAAAAFAAPMGRWTGPITSPYGLHFVRVTAVEPARAAAYASVRRQAWYVLRDERERAEVTAALHVLRARYPVVVAASASTVSALP